MARLKGGVVVITGASSGVGRALAVEMAKKGARLALCARRIEALEETARLCHEAGVEVLLLQADVTLEQDMARLAAAAMERWGRIDVWVNNAGVTHYAAVDQGEFAHHRRVIEVNLIGAMLGARAVLPVFRAQGAGVLINVGSVLSHIGHAYVPSYVISKFGLHGLSETLRVELADARDIHVCTVFPYSIDTQHFEVASTEIGLAPYGLPPIQSPQKVARAIVGVAERPRRVRFVPRAILPGLIFHALMPRTAELMLQATLRRWHLSNEVQLTGTGALYNPAIAAAAMEGTRPPRVGMLRLFAWLMTMPWLRQCKRPGERG